MIAVLALELTIAIPGREPKTFTVDQLLHHPSARSLVVRDSPAYPRSDLQVTAIPLAALVPADRESASNVVFECRDGFAAAIPIKKALGSGEAEAFLAIEDPAAPWPALAKDPGSTAGPFYLVWMSTRPGSVDSEEWPYQVTRITVRGSLEQEFPAIVPRSVADAASPIVHGFQVFVRQCFPCHTLNGAGDGHVGPDLNLPMSPTEYFKDGILEKYLRDPTSVRAWAGQRMPAFPENALAENELKALSAYLKHMAQSRR